MEKLLQYAWQHRMWKSADMTTTDGRRIEILDPGWLNTDSGPDFFNAKVRIDNRVWAGNIEIHLKASDWYRHGHHRDAAYDSVVLHVVETDDMEVKTRLGEVIPQTVFQCAGSLLKLSSRLNEMSAYGLLCSDEIGRIQPVYLFNWIDSLAYERLYEKTERFGRYLESANKSWEQALFAALARALGFGHNSEELERVALSIPISILAKHGDSPLQLKAILLGQAGLLAAPPTNSEEKTLLDEYMFLAKKFTLHQPAGLIWKQGRMRPGNFPAARLSLLAKYAEGGFALMREIIEASGVEALRKALTPPGESMSIESVNSLIINVAVPALYSYGIERGDNECVEKAMDTLRQLPAEQNRIVRIFESVGIEVADAYTSQALIQLRRSYCEQRKCLYCRIGNRMMRKK